MPSPGEPRPRRASGAANPERARPIAGRELTPARFPPHSEGNLASAGHADDFVGDLAGVAQRQQVTGAGELDELGMRHRCRQPAG